MSTTTTTPLFYTIALSDNPHPTPKLFSQVNTRENSPLDNLFTKCKIKPKFDFMETNSPIKFTLTYFHSTP
ncbi:hypothetical protein QVD17_31840 [Tagetes erecta]|uniref:Uncharacterized protein n=1 Tax=Tagetes erecta TaxID=13708 RepID=A0AAD8K8I7_TARER|nr:hypothetical protein QVD17_31840 [Tagetes erecta]